jgi:MFS family permease
LGKLRDNVAESGAAIGRVLRNRGLRRINLAFAGSIIGDWALAVAVSVYAYEQGGAAVLGAIAVIRYLTMAVLAPLMSMLADRFRRKRVMMTADAARAVLVTAAALVVAKDGPALAVYVLATATVVLGTAFRPAQAALLPSLATEPSELTAANVTASTIESVGFFAGPALAGFLLAVTSRAWVFAFDALTFVWSFVLLAGLQVDDAPPVRSDDEREGFVAETTAGFRVMLGDRDMRLLLMLLVGQTVVAGASAVFEVAVALRMLRLGQSGVGLLGAMTGIGGIIGGVVALALAVRKRLSFDFGVGVLLWATPLVLLAAWPSLVTAIAAMICIGVGNSLVDVNIFTILQRIAPEEVMGRVFGAVQSSAVAGMALGALAMPLLIATIGLRGGLAVIGVAITVLVATGVRGLNRIDTTTLAPAKLGLVAANEILGPLPENLQERLARALVEVRVPAGDVVCREGDAGDRYYIVEQGHGAVDSGGKSVNKLGPGDSFGEIALLRDVPRQATVRAIDDLVLQSLDREMFLNAVTRDGAANSRANNVIARFFVG